MSQISLASSKRWLMAATFLGLALSSDAATRVAYLQQIPVSVGKQQVYPIPAVSPGVGVGNYGPFNLPGYGHGVYVSLSCLASNPKCQVPELTWLHSKAAENQKTSNGLYYWGTDTDALSLYNTSNTNPSENYILTFYFTGIAPPNPSDLFLVVSSLKDGTTASLSGQTDLGNAAVLAKTNGGEYAIPANSTWTWCWPSCISTAPTVFDAGTLTFRSAWNVQYDDRNTGWDIYQPNSPNLRTLSINVNQLAGDGIGLTLGYGLCASLVGTSPQFVAGVSSPDLLYDFDKTTGAATNPRQLGGSNRAYNWGLAFSPISPTGTLYGLGAYRGTIWDGELLNVDPASGTAVKVPGTPPISTAGFVALAADPTSGILYGIDGWGVLFQVSTTFGRLPVGAAIDTSTAGRPYGDYYSMAFDAAGNLFIVNSSTQKLIKVPQSTLAGGSTIPNFSFALKGSTTQTQLGFASLAIDPWSGTAYYADDSLYTLNLTSNPGQLTLVGKLTGTLGEGADSLTFTVGACRP